MESILSIIPNLPKEQEHEKDLERVYFSEDVITCFACGEKISGSYKKCPYCGTKLDNK
jgi:uncharacterized protein CbrC (UPF0167 family)